MEFRASGLRFLGFLPGFYKGFIGFDKSPTRDSRDQGQFLG